MKYSHLYNAISIQDIEPPYFKRLYLKQRIKDQTTDPFYEASSLDEALYVILLIIIYQLTMSEESAPHIDFGRTFFY